MWCDRCQSEVLAEATAGAGGLRCRQCGAVVSDGQKTGDAIRHARAILERWQSSDLLDRIRTTEEIPPLVWSSDASRRDVTASSTAGAVRSDVAGDLSASAAAQVPPAKQAPLSTQPPINEVAAAAPVAGRGPQASRNYVPWQPRRENRQELSGPGATAASALTAEAPADDLKDAVEPVDSFQETSPARRQPMTDAGEPASLTAASLTASVSSAAESLWAGRSAQEPAVAGSDGAITGHPNAVEQSAADDDRVVEYHQSAAAAEPGAPESPELAVEQQVPVNQPTAAQASDSPEQGALSENQLDADALAAGESPAAEPFANGNSPAERSAPVRSAQFFGVTQVVAAAAMEISDDSAPIGSSPPNSAVPAESAAGAATKMTHRQPVRRPPLKRRYGKPAANSASPAGPTNVNRKLRVDLPGGPTVFDPAAAATEATRSAEVPGPSPVSNAGGAAAGRRFRIDSAESVDQLTGTDSQRTRTQGKSRRRFIDEAHGSALAGPHFQVSSPRRSNLTALTGQFLAYLGVLGLTIGTAIVIYGHFGGYSEYTPTGWLVTTVAQMLLFLGVINLVSGGIEQTNDDVSRRINSLGEQLLRIEQVTEEVLRGPRLPARLYADSEAAEAEVSQRETVVSE